MDCFVCNSRSAVDSCSECQALLCEVCGVKCDQCGKMVCPDHVHKTRHGHNLCVRCNEARKAHKDKRKGGAEEAAALAGTSLEALEGGREEEEAIEDEALVASVRKLAPPWKLSLYAACTGAVLVLIILLLPGLRRIPLPGGGSFPTSYFFLIPPLIAVFWSVTGLVREDYREERPRCLIGLGVALVTCVLVFVAVFTDPVRRAEIDSVRSQDERNNMTVDELGEWREEKLNRFNP